MSCKIFLVTAGASLIGALIAASLVLVFQRQQCIANSRAANDRLGNVVQVSLMQGMLANDWASVEQVVQTLAEEMHVETINILDGSGRIKISSTPIEVRQRRDRLQGTSLLGQAGTAQPRPQTETVRSHGNHADLITTRALYNRQACQACHGSQTATLGFLTIVTPLPNLQHRLTTSAWRILMSAAITFLLLVGVLTFFLRKLVLQPVNELRDSVAALEVGNFEHPLAVQGEDESSTTGKAGGLRCEPLKAVAGSA